MATLTHAPIGAQALGAFGKARPSSEAFAILLELLRDERFLVPAAQAFVGGCGDERLDVNGTRWLAPTLFGGFACAVLADALTARFWYRPGMNLRDHLLQMGQQVPPEFGKCVHTDDRAGEECGCAAIAQMSAVVELMIQMNQLIPELHRQQIVSNAQDLLQSGYFRPGTSQLVKNLGVAGFRIETLSGQHTGVACVRNTQENLVYDRPALYAELAKRGLPAMPFFELDLWSIGPTVQELYVTQVEQQAVAAAVLAFNDVVQYAIFDPAMTLVVA